MKKDLASRKNSNWLAKLGVRPVFVIGFAFVLLILLGSLLLFLPFTHVEGASVKYEDALFTSVSATCVTGLVTLVNGIGGTYNNIGHLIIMILIQLGGLGASSIGVMIFVLTARHLSFNQQALIKESYNINNFKSIRKVFFFVLLITLSVEFLGSILLFLDFHFLHHDLYNGSLHREAFAAVFTSLSAYNNAGFDIFGANSIIAFQNDYFFLSIIAILIIFGGLGYVVVIEVIKKKFNIKKFSLHAKVVLLMTLILIVAGGLGIFTLENLPNQNDYSAFGSGNTHMNLFNAFFLSISCRTAGFTTYPLVYTRTSTLIIMMVLMIIGGSPGGTAGGFKTTTLFVIGSHFISQFTKKKPHGFRRNFKEEAVSKALTLFFTSVILLLIGIVLVLGFESRNVTIVNDQISTYGANQGFTSTDFMFEVFSALGTVGLSTGYTPYLTLGSKIILMIFMYLGRIGPLSVTQMFNKKPKTWTYPEEDISVG